MSTDLPNEIRQGWIKPSVDWSFRCSTDPYFKIDSSRQFLSKAFVERTAELFLDTAETPGSRRSLRVSADRADPRFRPPEDRIVASATTTTSASSTSSLHEANRAPES
jgi:hypothetical protein